MAYPIDTSHLFASCLIYLSSILQQRQILPLGISSAHTCRCLADPPSQLYQLHTPSFDTPSLQYRQASLQKNIPTARSNAHAKRSRRHHPLLQADIPVTQISLPNVESHRSCLTSCQTQLGKSSQLLWGGPGCRRRVRDVQLGNLSTRHLAGIPNIRSYSGDGIEKIARTSWHHSSGSRSRLGNRCDGEASIVKLGVSCFANCQSLISILQG